MRLLSLLALFTVGLPGVEMATVNDWQSYGGTHAALRYSALEQNNSATCTPWRKPALSRRVP